MTILPSKDFDLIKFLTKEKSEIRKKMGFDCEIEVELGSEWVYKLESDFDSWTSHYADERSTILGMPLRINYKNPDEVKIWVNGVN